MQQYDEHKVTCCSNSDFYFIRYVTQLAISIIILLFAIIMICLQPSNHTTYFSMITLIIGVYIEPPKMK
jgi:hypothetical protein